MKVNRGGQESVAKKTQVQVQLRGPKMMMKNQSQHEKQMQKTRHVQTAVAKKAAALEAFFISFLDFICPTRTLYSCSESDASHLMNRHPNDRHDSFFLQYSLQHL